MEQRKEYVIFGDKMVYINDPLPEGFDTQYVIDTLQKLVPAHFAHEVDYIVVGQNDEFAERDINAVFKDGAIYVTNDQDDEDDMLDDIVHELAHAVEKMFGAEIYGDGDIELEFLGKRKRLFDLLKADYGEDINVLSRHFLNVEYSKKFDEFLYRVIGYPKLTTVTMGLFISPYGITSLREYFANGMEEYFLRDREYMNTISPELYSKINYLVNNDHEQ